MKSSFTKGWLKVNDKIKHILLGITGGIAAYKICDLIRLLKKQGHDIDVIMTKNAMEFITPLTIQTLTGKPVYTELFSLINDTDISHISLADRADIIVVAPATANFIGKISSGIADDLLTTTIFASKSTVLIVPSMNTNMWDNPIVKNNIKHLQKFYHIMQPAEGLLACGVYGAGRLPDVEDIYNEINCVLTEKTLNGKKIVITAGPTVEELDPVRYISNYSSGKMGYSIAKVAKELGATVTLVTGPVSQSPPFGVKVISVKSAEDMLNACKKEMNADIFIMAAAVCDYKPIVRSNQKIKKDKEELTLKLSKNPDILTYVSQNRKKGAIVVGFAAETENVLKNAHKKLVEKKVDLIVANKVNEEGSGFGTDTNKITLITKKGVTPFPLMKKEEVANAIFQYIVENLIN